MGAEQVGGLDDLLMGNVAEGSEETSEQIAARISSAQARLAAVKKDEKKTSKHDTQLAQVIKHLPMELIPFVSWLINHEIPSLTILAILSLSQKPADDALKSFDVLAGETKEQSFLLEIRHTALRAKISNWSQQVLTVDALSTTVRLASLQNEQLKNSRFTTGIRAIIEEIWLRSSAEFDPEMLDRFSRVISAWLCSMPEK
jgi:hypothetical protein